MAIESFRGRYRFLSNFFPALIDYDGIVYPTVEHAYQAAKSLSPRVRQRIATAATAQEAKSLGGQVSVRPDWEDVKITVMEDLLRKKFSNREVADLLLLTGDEEIIEGNWWNDTFWGVCRGEGLNHLGKLLMKIRASL